MSYETLYFRYSFTTMTILGWTKASRIFNLKLISVNFIGIETFTFSF